MNGDGREGIIRVLLAEPDDDARNDMRQRLAAEPGVEVVGIASDGERAERLATQLQPDVAILSLNLPRVDGIAATESIGVSVPFCQVIVLSDQGEVGTLRRAMIAGAREFLVKPVHGDDLVAAVQRVYTLEAKRRGGRPGLMDSAEDASSILRQRMGRAIVVFGPKGGVGRTFVAANLAVAMASRTKQPTLLIDGSLHFGSVDVALDVTSKKSIIDLLVDSDDQLDPDLVERVVAHHSSGLDVLLAPPADTLLRVSPIHVQRIMAVLRCLYSYIIIDTHPSLDETTLAFLDLSDQIITIATPELTALRNLRVFLSTASHLGYSPEKICLVINRFDMRNALPLSEIETVCKRSITLTLPNDYDVVAGSINAGTPLVMHHPERMLSKQIIRLANMMVGNEKGDEAKAEKRIKGLGRIFGRQN